MDATPNFARATQHALSAARHGEAAPAEVVESTASRKLPSQDLNTKL